MRVIISGHVDDSFGFSEVITDLSGLTEKHFLHKEYGSGIASIVIILVCHPPDFIFTVKRRIRFTKKDKVLGLEMILNFQEMKRLDHPARRRRTIELILEDVPKILDKYSIPDFDRVTFMEDFRSWLKNFE